MFTSLLILADRKEIRAQPYLAPGGGGVGNKVPVLTSNLSIQAIVLQLGDFSWRLWMNILVCQLFGHMTWRLHDNHFSKLKFVFEFQFEFLDNFSLNYLHFLYSYIFTDFLNQILELFWLIWNFVWNPRWRRFWNGWRDVTGGRTLCSPHRPRLTNENNVRAKFV